MTHPKRDIALASLRLLMDETKRKTPEELFSQGGPHFMGIMDILNRTFALYDCTADQLHAMACAFGVVIANLEQRSPQPITFEEHLGLFCEVARVIYKGEQEMLQNPHLDLILMNTPKGPVN